MLQVAWNLRELIEEFFDIYEDAKVTNDRLDDIEWATIRVIKEFLEKLSMSTKACESRNSTLDLTLPCTDYILSQFEAGQSIYKDDAIFGPMFRSGWKKMNKYYNLFDKTPVYAAALVLHPSRKWRHIEK
ncbi:transposase-like protein, partial [Leptodontidium sp. MPI-SDFR-AT-0119]